VFSDDISDYHVLCDHGAHLVGISALPSLINLSIQTILAAQGLLDLGRDKTVNIAVK
jgi:hypothetical protein